MTRSPWMLGLGALGLFGLVMVLGNLGGGALNESLLYLPGIDKILHFALALLVFSALHRLTGRTNLSAGGRLVAAASGATLLVLADELQQQFVSNRTVELMDVAAGLCGVLAGVARQFRPAVTALLGAASVIVAAGVTFDSYRESRDYNRGVLAERDGRRIDALRHYRAAAESGVRNPEAYNALAWAILETGQGDPREAVRYAEQSLTLRPDNPDTLDTYGWALYQAGQAAQAVFPLERAAAADPDIYCVHYHLGMAYLESGRRDDGRRHLRAQIERNPRTREARLSAEMLTKIERAVTP